ncbi:MAG: hypothetical protein IPL71_22960 [Anaerolineales bacterium]|uniref:hypothetical protein n=1 Tax=Candidatus Villigracilis proximus TaxID=3140683 RepID=UPI00313603F0|nr:hypothetical protein [Anaerolineales bacterium]
MHNWLKSPRVQVNAIRPPCGSVGLGSGVNVGGGVKFDANGVNLIGVGMVIGAGRTSQNKDVKP